MTVQPTGAPGAQGVPPLRILGVGILVVLLGFLVLAAATIDPWLLVMLGGLGVVAWSLLRSDLTDFGRNL